MKRFYFPIFATAAFMASCNDDFNDFTPASVNVEINGITFTVSNSDATRVNWDESTAPKCGMGDKFSLFNIGKNEPRVSGSEVQTSDALKANANAAYKTTDGSNFASENILYKGYHALFFPLNTELVSADDAIVVKVGTAGENGLGNNSVFLSNDLVHITDNGIQVGEGDDAPLYNQPGYNKNIHITTHAASAGFILSLVQSRALGLKNTDPKLNIKEVSLEAVSEVNSTPSADGSAPASVAAAEGATYVTPFAETANLKWQKWTKDEKETLVLLLLLLRLQTKPLLHMTICHLLQKAQKYILLHFPIQSRLHLIIRLSLRQAMAM